MYFENLNLDTRTFYTGARDHLFDPLSEFSYGTPNSKADIQQYGFHLLPTIYLLKYNQIFRALIAKETETFKRDRRNSFDMLLDNSTRKFRNHYTLQLSDEVRLFSKNLILTPSVILENYIDRFNDLNNNATSVLQNNETSKNYSFTNYRIGFLTGKDTLKFSGLQIKGNLSSENRIPTFMELFGERGAILGNTSLKPERSISNDIGILLNTKKGLFNVSSSVAIFSRKITNMILFVPNSQFALKPENVDSASIKGAEFGFKTIYNNMIKFDSNYTYQKAINTSDISYLKGKYLPLRPKIRMVCERGLYSQKFRIRL